MALSAAAWGKAARCRVEARDRGVLHVTLLDGTRSVNAEMVEQGLARVEKTANRKAAPLVAKLREKEDEAKAAHRGVWRYGDVEEDDAPEFGKPAPKPAAAPSKPAPSFRDKESYSELFKPLPKPGRDPGKPRRKNPKPRRVPKARGNMQRLT